MGIEHNAHRVAANLEAKALAFPREVIQTLEVQSQMLARLMRREAPKDLSALVNSIHVESPSPYEKIIAPGVDYAFAVHEGRKPGKGLPWYMDPAAKPLQDWLERHLGGDARNAKPGSSARQSHEQALRDIYIGMSIRVKRKGIAGNPFARRAHEARLSTFVAEMRAAATRAARAGGGS